MLTNAQYASLASGLRAEPSLAAAITNGDMVSCTTWANTVGTVDAWNSVMQRQELFDATDITKFDGITAGKRDAWRLMLDFSPSDFSRNKVRKAVVDIWGSADSVAILQAGVRKATNGENAIGGTSATTNTVTALNLKYNGYISMDDVTTALQKY